VTAPPSGRAGDATGRSVPPGARWPLDPVVLEIDTWVWLDELGRHAGRRVTLGSVPERAWDQVLAPGLDAVWLMGVWERSPYAARRAHEVWADQARELLPDLTHADVPGSPYAVRRYVVDEHLGGDEGLAVARAQLARRGVRLVLDHVPNHVAVEHPWVREHPEVVVGGTAAELAAEPEAFLRVGDRVVACGRDPNLPAWSDVVQLDPFSPRLRELTIATLRAIGDRADGVRVDMAMLLLDDVAERTWGSRIGRPLPRPFWVEVVQALRTTHPDLHLIAEAYWDRQPDLLAQGFDRCYDKDLGDALLTGDLAGVRSRLDAEVAAQHATVRFLENHDERRAAAAFGPQQLRAAAAVVALAPGGLLLFEGQLEGRRAQVPVGLGRRPDEALDPALRRWHDALLRVRARVDRSRARFVRHAVRPVGATDGSGSAADPPVLAWSWQGADEDLLVVVNLGTVAAVAVELDGTGVDRATGPARDAIDGRDLPQLRTDGAVTTVILAPGEVVVTTR
jgi:hypothetical protein